MPGTLHIKDLPKLVKAAFARALQHDAVTFYSTDVDVLNIGGTPFQVRFAAGLAKKPEPIAPVPGPANAVEEEDNPYRVLHAEDYFIDHIKRQRQREAKRALMLEKDPFKNPPSLLRIGDFGYSHYLVLNKFAIVHEHFILATREFKDQDHLLERDDFAAIRACIDGYDCPDGEDGLFTFFNSGEFSGASQAHRHIQMIPIARMKDGLEPGSPWTVVADRLGVKDALFGSIVAKLPFTVVVRNITGMDGDKLHAVYLDMYHKACMVEATATRYPKHDDVPQTEGAARISYNLAMTKDTMVLLPRCNDKVRLMDDLGEPLGVELSVNGTVLAGTVLVKDSLAFETIRSHPEALQRALHHIGVPGYLYPGPLTL
ncbi:hypothetical protein ACHAPT_002372 [Fusarium lateritium]